eukprot:916_1
MSESLQFTNEESKELYEELPITYTDSNGNIKNKDAPQVAYRKFESYTECLSNLQRKQRQNRNEQKDNTVQRHENTILLLEYLSHCIMMEFDDIYTLFDASTNRKKILRILQHLPVIRFELPSVLTTTFDRNTTEYIMLMSKPPTMNDIQYNLEITLFFIQKSIQHTHSIYRWFRFVMNNLYYHIDKSQDIKDHASILRLKRVCDIIASIRDQTHHGIRPITEQQRQKLFTADSTMIAEIIAQQDDTSKQLDIMYKLYENAKDEYKELKERKKVSFNANAKEKYALRIDLKNARDKRNKYHDHYYEMIENKKRAEIKEQRKKVREYMGKYNKGNKTNHEHKFRPELQRFLQCCLNKNTSFWAVDVRRRFAANLLTKTRDKTNDFKVYQEAFYKVVRLNNGVIRDGFVEYDEFSKVEDVWEWLGEEIYHNRIKSLSIFNLYGYSGSSRTHQGKRAQSIAHLNLNLYRYSTKGKTFVRVPSINKNHLVYQQQNTQIYVIKKAEEKDRMDELDTSSIDPCSVKKVGQADTVSCVRNKKELITNNIDPKMFGGDAPSQFGDKLLNQRSVAFVSYEGKVNENGELSRSAGRRRLDYSMTGPAWELTGSASDLINIQEAIRTCDITEEEEKLLLHKPQNDDLESLPLSFRTMFLRYQLRMRLIKYMK